MSFLYPSPDEEREYVRRASLAIQASDLLIAIKLLALGREIAKTREMIASAKRAGDAVDEESYLEMFRRKAYLESQGKHDLRMEILKEAFKEEMG